jgi:hypothetical protein
MAELNLDYDIIKELIPIEDKSSFLVISHQIRGAYIFATYKMLDDVVEARKRFRTRPFDDVRNLQEKFSWERTAPIPKSEYIKEKRERDLKKIIDSN